MALKLQVHFMILTLISIGLVATVLTEDPNLRRYESYDLERGPVFYEAYYPDNNHDLPNKLEDKRYFDRGTIVERTYQVPTNLFGPHEDFKSTDSYQAQREQLRYLKDYIPRSRVTSTNDYLGSDIARNLLWQRYNEEVAKDKNFPVDKVSGIVRREIPRELVAWNSPNNYVRLSEQWSYPGLNGNLGARKLEDFQDHILGRNIFPEDIQKEGLASVNDNVRLLPLEQRANVILPHDLELREFLLKSDPAKYQELPDRFRSQWLSNTMGLGTVVDKQGQGLDLKTQPITDPIPLENTFALRPQVLNYIFSQPKEQATKGLISEAKLRNYGDNLIQEEIKKSEKRKDENVKVTSIEVSDVPKHKTRHHHGEWQKRNYSHFNKA